MRIFLHVVFLAFTTSLFSSAAWPQTEPALIPRQAIFANPDKEQVMLSPDGKWIGYRAHAGGTMNVWVAPASEPAKARAVIKQSGQSGAPVVDYRWAYLAGRLLYCVPADEGVHVFLLNLDNGESRDLTPGKGVVAFIEKFSPDHLEEVLLRVQEPARATVEYKRLNLRTDATEEGRALLPKASPFHYAASFAKPVLMAQGGKDQIVPQKQSDRFVAELQQHKKPVTYLLYPDEPHDFVRAENWASLFAIAEAFFHDHLGGRYQPHRQRPARFEPGGARRRRVDSGAVAGAESEAVFRAEISSTEIRETNEEIKNAGRAIAAQLCHGGDRRRLWRDCGQRLAGGGN